MEANCIAKVTNLAVVVCLRKIGTLARTNVCA